MRGDPVRGVRAIKLGVIRLEIFLFETGLTSLLLAMLSFLSPKDS